MLAYLTCVKGQCNEITDQRQCNENEQCEWDYWSPSKCQNICNQLKNQNECNFAANCKWVASSSSCFIRKCTEELQQDRCCQIVACSWRNNQCWDSSCVTLQASEAGKCANSYCIWDQKRKLCYDKKCSDYSNQYDCDQISFCSWFKYKCIDDGNNKIDYQNGEEQC
ncbi:unnamed protein product (macronuclear) [Paramecium tetraurelia]|uniref:Uncharacterized protein n=1 Tax=Paramecium tetraurelia TaxID=5888 RepID=A0CFP8_PARTE|nr:uncharacterized protein GSPATT00038056001 [Paramecium tetraurelia]CAK69615.1 unnamed protein product [Paramecium tetraurelia]|eukprot:XP_001437012.1 hypothetical protein (macronuclear) [Paramecium tetraurelia strain d4-2]